MSKKEKKRKKKELDQVKGTQALFFFYSFMYLLAE